MKHVVISIAVSLALLPLMGIIAQEPALNYRLNVGERFFLESDLQQNTHSESVDSEEISFYNLTRVEFLVDSIDASGHYHMSVQYSELLISMLAPRMDIDISSASGKDRLLSQMVDMMEQEAFSMVMTPQGELTELNGLEELFSSLSALEVEDTTEQEVILNTLVEAYGPNAFRSLCHVFLWIYPVIQPMRNWTNDIIYYLNTKPVKMMNRYYLSRTSSDAVVIQGLGMLNAMKEYHETTDLGEVKSAVSGTQTYDFQMDPETGWVKKCVSRQRVMIETTILNSKILPSGLKIPSYTETAFEVSGGRIAEPSNAVK
jgi:hypothetical protein